MGVEGNNLIWDKNADKVKECHIIIRELWIHMHSVFIKYYKDLLNIVRNVLIPPGYEKSLLNIDLQEFRVLSIMKNEALSLFLMPPTLKSIVECYV